LRQPYRTSFQVEETIHSPIQMAVAITIFDIEEVGVGTELSQVMNQ